MMLNKKNKITVFSNVDALNRKAAALLIDLAKKSIVKRGRFAVALSGGSTPKGLYMLLTAMPYCATMPWKNTFIFWSDERSVPADDIRNNAHMTSILLLNKIDIPPSNIFPVPVQMPPERAAKKYEETLRAFFGNEEPRFDLILLGLGENGHTASLFPGTGVLYEKSAWVKEVYVEGERLHRVTMTALLINNARNILFLVTGKEKSKMLETVLTGSYLPEKYPAQLIDPVQGEVRWFIEEKAVSRNLAEIRFERKML